jgi:hypothetical protein
MKYRLNLLGTAKSLPAFRAAVPMTSAGPCRLRARPSQITSATCWSHARRQFFELADIAANARRGKNAPAISPVALDCLQRIDALFDIERNINGLSAEERLRVPPGTKRTHSGRPGGMAA